ncbi:hypothetical protein TH2_083 [Shewanella phage Thanatos-2]|nr:hypothetical protein TH2_083 [Shewanella phage Thanatos-2]
MYFDSLEEALKSFDGIIGLDPGNLCFKIAPKSENKDRKEAILVYYDCKQSRNLFLVHVLVHIPVVSYDQYSLVVTTYSKPESFILSNDNLVLEYDRSEAIIKLKGMMAPKDILKLSYILTFS